MTQPATTTLTEQFARMTSALPKSAPFEPSAFVVGIIEQLREMAELIENGTLTVTHFSLTTYVDPVYKQRLEIEVN